jgi:hypothetical protein
MTTLPTSSNIQVTFTTPEGGLIDITLSHELPGALPLSVGDQIELSEGIYANILSKQYSCLMNEITFQVFLPTADFEESESFRYQLEGDGWNSLQ